MPLTPEKRDSFIKLFDEQFGEGATEQMFKAHDQMARAKTAVTHMGSGCFVFYAETLIHAKKRSKQTIFSQTMVVFPSALQNFTEYANINIKLVPTRGDHRGKNSVFKQIQH